LCWFAIFTVDTMTRFVVGVYGQRQVDQPFVIFDKPPDHRDVGFLRRPRFKLRGDGSMCLAVERHQHKARRVLVETIDHLGLRKLFLNACCETVRQCRVTPRYG